tara:strand:- start:370 stop:1053 length:684 start_codon:yes stop_codon:yes gene_type:complete
MKNILLLTGYTDNFRDLWDPDRKDDTIESVFDATLPSKLSYVKKHSYDIMCVTTFHGDSPRELGFSRMIKTFKMLQLYDIVMWIDADSLITNQDCSVEDIIGEANQPFIASHDWSSKDYISTGNFIIQKTEGVDDLFKSFYEIANNFPEEQSTINWIYNNANQSKHIKVLDHKYLNSLPTREMYSDSWNGRPDIISNWEEDSFLLHCGGVSAKTKNKILRDYFGKFL